MCFGGNSDPEPAPAPEPQEPLTWADAHSKVTGQSGPGGIGVTPTADALKVSENKADKAKREKKSRDKYRSKGRRPDGSRYADDRDPASRKNSKKTTGERQKQARREFIDDLRANPDGW